MDDINIKLCEGIQEDDLTKVEKCLKLEANPHKRIDHDKYFTPWNWVYSCENYSIILHLLNNGANVNCPIPELRDETVIFGAVFNKNEPIIKLFVEKGANINQIDSDGYTPLYATIEESEECLKLVPLLLRLGADLTIGMSQISRLRKKKVSLEGFYKKILDFLKQLEDENDYKLLEIHIQRIKALCRFDESFPQDLIDTMEDLIEIFDLNILEMENEPENQQNKEAQKEEEVQEAQKEKEKEAQEVQREREGQELKKEKEVKEGQEGQETSDCQGNQGKEKSEDNSGKIVSFAFENVSMEIFEECLSILKRKKINIQKKTDKVQLDKQDILIPHILLNGVIHEIDQSYREIHRIFKNNNSYDVFRRNNDLKQPQADVRKNDSFHNQMFIHLENFSQDLNNRLLQFQSFENDFFSQVRSPYMRNICMKHFHKMFEENIEKQRKIDIRRMYFQLLKLSLKKERETNWRQFFGVYPHSNMKYRRYEEYEDSSDDEEEEAMLNKYRRYYPGFYDEDEDSSDGEREAKIKDIYWRLFEETYEEFELFEELFEKEKESKIKEKYKEQFKKISEKLLEKESNANFKDKLREHCLKISEELFGKNTEANVKDKYFEYDLQRHLIYNEAFQEEIRARIRDRFIRKSPEIFKDFFEKEREAMITDQYRKKLKQIFKELFKNERKAKIKEKFIKQFPDIYKGLFEKESEAGIKNKYMKHFQKMYEELFANETEADIKNITKHFQNLVRKFLDKKGESGTQEKPEYPAQTLDSDVEVRRAQIFLISEKPKRQANFKGGSFDLSIYDVINSQ